MGKSKKSSSTSTVSPPSWYKDDLNLVLDEAKGLYKQGAPEYYTGQMTAGLDPLQREALNNTVNMARAGSPLVKQAQGFASDVLSADAGQNPYLTQLMDKYGREATAAVMGNFNKSGRLGSGANVDVAARSYADATLPYMFNQYNQDMQNKFTAAQIAPTLAEQNYLDQNRIATAGDLLQGQEQNRLNELYNKWQYETNAPYQNLSMYADFVHGSPAAQYSTQTTTSKSGGGGLGSVLGTIASIGSMFMGNPLGAAGIGAAGGMSGFGVGQVMSGLGAANLAAANPMRTMSPWNQMMGYR